MTPTDKDAVLRDLREGLHLIAGSDEKTAALVLNLYAGGLHRMYRDGLLPAEEAIDELRQLYKAVDAAHPGKWEALGGPVMPVVLTA